MARNIRRILNQRKFFDDVKPVNFNTIATPHVGLPRYPTWISSLAAYFGPKLLSRTGEQFYAVDKWGAQGRPLLEVMADPSTQLPSLNSTRMLTFATDQVFYQTLSSFQHLRIYANAVNDVTVPYLTAAIEVEDPIVKHNLDLVDVYVAVPL